MITIKDIAEETGLSITTVSLVLSGKAEARGIAVPTRQRVEEAAVRMGYRRNGFARALRTGRSNRIGIAGASFSHPIAWLGMRAAAEAILSHGFSVTLTDLAWQPEHPERVVDDLLGQRVEGLLVLGSRGLAFPEGRQAIQRLADHGLPVVTLDNLGLDGADIVTVDREQGAYLATRHLLALGHRRIALTVPASAVAPLLRNRIQGYERALREAGLEPDPTLLLSPQAPMPSFEDGHHVARQALSLPQPPTALFCVNDRVAIGAMQYLFQHGVRIPEEIALVGFDGLEEAAYTAVPLTTVEQPMSEVAERAVEVLIWRIQQSGTEHRAQRVVVAPRLVVRRSCGAGG